jgi:hypothetical protein
LKTKFLACPLLIILSLMPQLVLAAVRYDINVEVIHEDETVYLSERVTADGDNARLDFMDRAGQPDGSYMVTNDAGKTITVHDGDKSTCANWDRAEFFEAAAELMAKGQRMVNAKISDLETTVVSEEEGPEIEGYPTRHFKLRTHYSASGRLLFLKRAYDIEELDDIWVTNALKLPKIEEEWLADSSSTGNEFLDEHARAWPESTAGTILRHTNVVRMVNSKSGEVGEKTEHLTVSNISTLDSAGLPAGIFRLPACEKVKQSEMKHEAKKMLKKYIK